ncbi:hypothetical protein BpHYR1_046863 [Brachionus plicatilis]|uniref:Uncharacterized protein n=1 Tax=Brachionus plicatilis TaxID=10195 RepID=A0A3M7RGP7_BRAPC|nr:hypothetical protein BpHYR1_046863 [Brachionus plicatilis]
MSASKLNNYNKLIMEEKYRLIQHKNLNYHTDDNFDGENWKDDILNSVMDDTLSDDEEDDDCNDVIIDSAQTKKEVKISEIHRMIGEIRSYLTNYHPSLCKEFMTFESNLVDVANSCIL